MPIETKVDALKLFAEQNGFYFRDEDFAHLENDVRPFADEVDDRLINELVDNDIEQLP